MSFSRKISAIQICFASFIFEFIFQNVDCNECTPRETCGECIAENPLCAWCTQEGFSKNGDPRCDLRNNLVNKCHQDNLIAPSGSLRFVKDLSLSDQGAREHEAIQMRPQEIKIRLRPNTVKKFQVEFRQAVDYPIDLYYLMDLSNSMENDKFKLAKLGNKLADEMKTITNNFKLGFGSFVDKKLTPYANTHPSALNRPCRTCAAPYGYRNNMPLSSLTEEFAREVEKAPISGNVDPAEGGFDALMQAIVCEKQIGWRNKSRKLLVFSTDDSFHYAGDGKLGGVVKPNDEKCHLDKDGYYTMSTELDYPSLGQINKQMRDHKINLIFAVEKTQVKLYKTLAKRLVGSTTGELAEDSSNIVDLVRQQYDEITSSVDMTDDVGDSNIRISYYSKCFGSKKEKTHICRGLKVGKNVTFEVNLEYSLCPQNPKERNKTFQIFPVGLQDQLTVHLEMICECECEKAWNEEAFSSNCSNHGTFECGICNCNRQHYGEQCECYASETDPFLEGNSCVNGKDTRICSGVGKCLCGQCYCDERTNQEEKFYGKYCECNNFNCDKSDGKICNGHGVCDCGVCKCHKGWKGSSCTCRNTNETCMGSNNEICSGHGVCKCGVCDCENSDYFGTFCDDCSRCPGLCNDLRECVECFLESRKNPNLNCSMCGDDVLVLPVQTIEVKEKEKACPLEDENNCRFVFKYAFDEKSKLNVWVKMGKECPTPVDAVAIASGVSGGVVATGLFLLMLWKILTVVHDRRELAKFEKERLMAKWNQGQNPLYKEVQTTYQNPAYSGATKEMTMVT